MRYACPSCKRVFYLETKTVSPCPACGTTLTMEGGEEGEGQGDSAAPADAAADSKQSSGESWLFDGAESETATQATAAPFPPMGSAAPPPAPPPPPAPSPAPPPPTRAPTVQSWLTPPAGSPEPVPEPEPLGPAAAVPPSSDPLGALNTAARSTASDTSGMPAASRTARMSSARGPSGSRVFLITSTAVIATAAVALAALIVFKDKLPTFQTRGPTVARDNSKEVDKLKGMLRDADSKLAEEQQKVRDANKARQDLELKLVEAGIELGNLKGRLEKISTSLGYLLEAQALFERHADLEGALSLVDAALKRDPGMLEAWRLKGKILAASGIQAQPALETFERADKAAKDAGDPGDPHALVLAGEVCLTDLGDSARALDYYKRAAELTTVSPFKLAAEARVSQIMKRPERAMEKANELAKAEPSLALAPLIAGEVVFGQAQAEQSAAKRGALLKKADIHLAKAVKLDPNSARACLMRGQLLLEQAKLTSGIGFGMAGLGPRSRAERLLSTAKQLKPNVPDVHLALAELSLTKGALRNPAEALQSATEAVRLTGRKSAPALALLAQAHAANGSPSKAVVAIQEAMTIEPRNPSYMELLRQYKEETKSLSR